MHRYNDTQRRVSKQLYQQGQETTIHCLVRIDRVFLDKIIQVSKTPNP